MKNEPLIDMFMRNRNLIIFFFTDREFKSYSIQPQCFFSIFNTEKKNQT